MKKVLASVLLIVFTLSVALFVTGCSSDELGFYQTVKEVNSLKNYDYSGSVTLKINKLEQTVDGGDLSMSAISALLNNAVLRYNGRMDSSNSKFTMNLSYTSGDGVITDTFHFIFDNGNGKSLIDLSPEASVMLTSMIPTGYTPKDVTIEGIEYYQYDVAEIIQEIEAMQPAVKDNPYQESTQKALFDAFNSGYDDGYAYNDDNSAAYTGDAKTAYLLGYQQGSENAASDGEAENLKLALPTLRELTSMAKLTPEQQDLQNKLASTIDELVNSYFKNLSLGLVKKTGDSTYTCESTITDIYSALKKVVQYIADNPQQFKTILVNFANSLSDSQVKSLGLGAETKTELVALINGIPFSEISDSLQAVDEQVQGLADSASVKVGFSLQKIGRDAFSISDSLSANNNSRQAADLRFDIGISQVTDINGGSRGNVGSVVSQISLMSAAPTLSLQITDPNVVETGIMISRNKDMSSAKKLAATKQGSSYVVNLSGYQDGSTYYMQIYTVDRAGNILVAKQISELDIPLAGTAVNPDTGDRAAAPADLCGIEFALAILALAALKKARKFRAD